MIRACSILLLLFTHWLSPAADAQGTFEITLTGTELYQGERLPVTGSGSLQLFGGTMHYFIHVPEIHVLPREAHFHGPAVDQETPIFSLAPFTQEGNGIVYRNSRTFDSKYLPDIRAGKWYINLHSGEYENGVLSGDIVPVPEPRMLALLIVGLLTLRGASSVRSSAYSRLKGD